MEEIEELLHQSHLADKKVKDLSLSPNMILKHRVRALFSAKELKKTVNNLLI